MSVQEAISIHIGQAGIQLGHAFWELICSEHGIQANGKLDTRYDSQTASNVFFQETPSGQNVPRAIMCDFEPTVIDEIKAGRYRQLFHPELMLNGQEDAGNNFARGYYTLGKCMINTLIEKTRFVAEGCDTIQGFIVYNSFGGGTGSGLTSLYIDRLKVEFGRKTVIDVSILPGKQLSTSTVEPYNSLMVTEHTLDTSDITLLIDNESLYDICSQKLKSEAPTYVGINRLIAPMISGLTCSLRYGAAINCSINEIQTNLVPYPRIHFPFMSYAPLFSTDTHHLGGLSTFEMTSSLFDKYSQTVNCDIEKGKFMASCLIYRGSISANSIFESISEIKNSKVYDWVDWCPTGFKFGVVYTPPTHVAEMKSEYINKGVVMLTNHTAVSQCFESVTNKFDRLFQKRAFVHWYVGEGMEEDEFIESRCTMSYLIRDYYEICDASKNDDDGDEDSDEPIQFTINEYKEIMQQETISKKSENSTTKLEPFILSSAIRANDQVEYISKIKNEDSPDIKNSSTKKENKPRDIKQSSETEEQETSNIEQNSNAIMYFVEDNTKFSKPHFKSNLQVKRRDRNQNSNAIPDTLFNDSSSLYNLSESVLDENVIFRSFDSLLNRTSSDDTAEKNFS